MNGRVVKCNSEPAEIVSQLKDSEKISFLQKENQELQYEISNIRMTLEINKNLMIELLSANSKEKQIKALALTVNSLTKENMNLQNEIQRMQDEYIKAIRHSYVESLKELNSK